jgi:CPA1 family monovalent cation:H+ antiporter
MDPTVVSLAMLLAVVVSTWLVRSLPLLLPLPLIQVGLGALIGLTATYRVSLAPDVFFLLFLPPLLFLDAWRIPRDALFWEGSWASQPNIWGPVVWPGRPP